MTAEEWNARFPVGTRVQLTLADGQRKETRTLTPAQTWGGLDHVAVAGLSGFVLLSWVAPREPQVSLTGKSRQEKRR